MSKDRDDELNSSPEFSLEEILAEFGGGGQRDVLMLWQMTIISA